MIQLKPDFKKGWFLLAKALWKDVCRLVQHLLGQLPAQILALQEGRFADAKKELDAGLEILPECADLLDLQHLVSMRVEFCCFAFLRLCLCC